MQNKFYDRSKELLPKFFGDNPEKVNIYTLEVSRAKSGMSGVYKALVIVGDHLFSIAERRVRGFGLDRGFELAYNIFRSSYPDLRYQDHLNHQKI